MTKVHGSGDVIGWDKTENFMHKYYWLHSLHMINFTEIYDVMSGEFLILISVLWLWTITCTVAHFVDGNVKPKCGTMYIASYVL